MALSGTHVTGDGGHVTDHNLIDTFINTTAPASYVPAKIATGTGIDPTGTTDSAGAIQALITGLAAGAALLFPAGIYKLGSTLTINKTMRFGGMTATRTSNDNSDPSAGVQFVYTPTTGDAILVQPPNAVNSRISPHLHDFLVRGNKNVASAASGGGIKLDGRNLSGTAISGFTIEDVHVSEAKGDGFTVSDNVYEGRIVGLNSTDNGGKGFVSAAPGGGVPGEVALIDCHTHDNIGDGMELRGGGSWSFHRLSSSRNGGAALDVSGVQLFGFDLQAESNTGSQTVILDTVVKCMLLGVNIAYPAAYAGVGIDVTNAATRNPQIISSFFAGSCLYDIRTAATQEGVGIVGYYQSSAAKLSLATGTALVQTGPAFVGNLVVTGKGTFSDDVTLGSGAGFIMTGKYQVGSDGRPKWIDSGNTQTTVGAAGGASALPATPVRYLQVRDAAGTVLVVPAYTS